ncbi:PEP/pyruvate-binding domain-containing protein [Labrenzia sp. VG12]|uniref:PEP/pyruvate-binding domain-containing protein n=1 Tax=Labrenzia sp. VG12 TaxID=2021862 RepID=UPI0018DF3145|nr:PEP/pyruvate-binding domain-containing protein [Labrenzia sp. VG12]
MTALVTWQQAQDASQQTVGGKAFVLAELAAQGFKVPPFFVLSPEAFENGGLTETARKRIEAACGDLPGDLYAVRSSGRAEDGAADSHAGQFLSLLEVASQDVGAAAEKVFASGLSSSVDSYRSARGLTEVDMPSVIVQAMVNARAAGVAFAADPVSGRRDQVLVSATAGLGDALVSGEVDGETWRFSLPKLELLETPAGEAALDLDEARAVARLCVEVTGKKGAPQDIEWALGQEDGAPYLLQARPITTQLLPVAPAETRLLVFDNSNIVESYPGIVSPLTYSFAVTAYARVYRTFLNLIGTPPDVIRAHSTDLANMLARIDGRLYYNLGNWYRLLSLLPFFSSNRQHMETMMGVSEPLPDEAMAGAEPTRSFLSGFVMVARLAWAAVRLKKTHAGFMERVEETIPPREDWQRLCAKSLSELAAEYRRVELALLDDWDAPIVNDFLCMMAFGGSRKLLETWAGQAGLALHNDVMIGQGDIISAEPARLIREMGELVRQSPGAVEVLQREEADEIFAVPGLASLLQHYLNRFGDRRIGELKLEQPTLDEAPEALFRAVAAAANRDVAEPVRTPPDDRLKKLFGGKPVKRFAARLALGYAKARVRDRENLRFERTRIFGYARRVFRAMGATLTATGQLETRDEVFLLSLEELLGIAEGSASGGDISGLIALRGKEQEDVARLPDPPERILVRGSVTDRATRQASVRIAGAGDDETQRYGTACGGGVVTGIARVIHDPAEEQVQAGEILVARHTDPGWISHFANAAAVVGERGSVLSHSAIVSRELGIPCVVAVNDACSWIRTGDRIEVDGSNGWVKKIR